MKFSGFVQNILLHLPTNFQPSLFTQPNHFLAFLTFKITFKMAFFQLLFLVKLSDTLIQIGFVHTFAGVRLLKSSFYYCFHMVMANVKMMIWGLLPKFLK